MSKNPKCKSNDDDDDDGDDDDDEDDEDDDADADDETLRRGCCVKRRTRHVTRVHLGGAWNWTFRAERRYLEPKREHPTMSMVSHHLVHLNSHLEVRHAHRAGTKKTRSVLAQTPKSLLRYLWMLEPVTFIAPLGTGQMDVEKSELQVE